MPPDVFTLRRQPFKGVFLSFAILRLLLILLPWWTIRNLFPSWRPRRSWRLSWCLRNNAQRYMIEVSKTVGGLSGASGLDTRPGVLELYIDGISPTQITGKLKEWANHAHVSPVRIPSYWVHGPHANLTMGEKPSGEEKVLLYLHGGGYIAFSAHPDSPTGLIPRSILEQCAGVNANVKRALCVEYRLSTYDPNPRENPFPAALLDALAAYAYLVNDVGFDPKDVVVLGDSAGGNLAIALVRYIIEQKNIEDTFAPPGAMILLSPWCDIGSSNSEDLANTMHTNARSDYLDEPFMLPNGRTRREYHHLAFACPHGVEFLDKNVYVSPGSLFLRDEEVRFEGFPPTFMDRGGGELFVDQIGTLERWMRRDIGNKLEFHEAKDAVHDYMWVTWQEPHRRETVRAIEQWLEKLYVIGGMTFCKFSSVSNKSITYSR